MPLRQHDAHLMLQTQDCSQHVSVKGCSVALGRLLGNLPGLALCASIIHRDVESAEALDGLSDQGLHVVFMPHVGAHEVGLRPKLTKFLGESYSSVVAPAGDDDSGAFAR